MAWARRMLITGGTGYLGGALCNAAAAAGWNVLATVHTRPPRSSPAPPPTWLALDLTEPASITRAVAQAQPDAIIHTAYVESGPDLDAVTNIGAGRIAAAAASAGARLVHISTDVVFDGAAGRAYVEADPLAPLNTYAKAKAKAEQRVAVAAPDAAIVRTSLLYDGRSGRHDTIALQAAAGELDYGFYDDEFRCPAHVDDLAAAVVELASVAHAGPLHLVGADRVSRYDFARMVALANGRDPQPLRHGPRPPHPPRPGNLTLDSAHARGLLTCRIRGVGEVLGLTVAELTE